MISLNDNKYPASHGVDGDINTFFHTRKEDVAWWAVDLGAEKAHVTRVRIVNRHTTADWGQLTLSCHHYYHTHARTHVRTHARTHERTHALCMKTKCFSILGENTGEHVCSVFIWKSAAHCLIAQFAYVIEYGFSVMFPVVTLALRNLSIG